MDFLTTKNEAPVHKRKYIRKYETAFNRVVRYLEQRGAKPLFYGSHRASMIRGDVVYKIGVSFEGIKANFEEDYFFNKICKKKEYVIPHFRTAPERGGSVLGFARCRLIWIHRIPVLMMERVTPFHQNDDRISADMCELDGGQFGEGRKGDYLSYDYSRTLLYKVPCEKYTDELMEKISVYKDKFYRIYKNYYHADTTKFTRCFGVPSIECVKTIMES